MIDETDAGFLIDLASRIFAKCTPAMGFDQGDSDRLCRIAEDLTPLDTDTAIPAGEVPVTPEIADALHRALIASSTVIASPKPDTDTPVDPGVEGVTDQQVRDAMQTAWDDFCDDTGAIPGDIYREGGKTFFRAGTWADHAAMHLRAALAAKPIAGMDAGEDGKS